MHEHAHAYEHAGRFQLVHMSVCVHRDMKHAGSLESMKDA